MEDYKQGDTIYILMKRENAEELLDDWMRNGYECELHIHKSKQTQGCVVVETKDIMWANRIIKWHRYERVTYKHKKQ